MAVSLPKQCTDVHLTAPQQHPSRRYHAPVRYQLHHERLFAGNMVALTIPVDGLHRSLGWTGPLRQLFADSKIEQAVEHRARMCEKAPYKPRRMGIDEVGGDTVERYVWRCLGAIDLPLTHGQVP